MKQSQVLIVYEAQTTSQRYRARHLQEQLQLCGIACRMAHLKQVSPACLLENEVVVFQRVSWDKSLGQTLRQLRRERVVTVFDIDDLLFEPELMRQGLVRVLKNTEWLHQVLSVRQAQLNRSMVQEVDAVLTTTEYLTDAAKALNPRAFTHRNAFSQDMWAASEQARAQVVRDRTRLVIGYASGTASHDYDFQVVQPALRQLLANFPHAELHIIGPLRTELERGSTAARVKRLPFVHWTQLPRLLAQFDLNLAPLEVDNPFCQAKSEIKYMEAALVQVPTVASPTQAFRYAIEDGWNGLLVGAGESWEGVLRNLVEAAEDRRRLAENAFQDVAARYHPLVRGTEMLRLLQQLCQERRGELLVPTSPDRTGGYTGMEASEDSPPASGSRRSLASRLFRAVRNHGVLTLSLGGLLWVQRRANGVLVRLKIIRGQDPLGDYRCQHDVLPTATPRRMVSRQAAVSSRTEFFIRQDSTSEVRVAVCMATYNPPPALFERQVESLRAQTHSNWICVINDDCSLPESVAHIRRVVGSDERFVFAQNAERQGFYRNFERCLTRVPADAEFIALADQDDYWYAEKLATLLAQFTPGVTLAYSDMKVVDDAGRRLADTFWAWRRSQAADLAVLLMDNTVAGAASMFRRELLDYALPFPEPVGRSSHDHWIACAALALGEIRYVDRPLYDYVRHSENVTRLMPQPSFILRLLRAVRRLTPERCAAWYTTTSDILRRGRLFARTLDERCGELMKDAERLRLRRLADGDLTALNIGAIYVNDQFLYYRMLVEAGLWRARRLWGRLGVAASKGEGAKL
jgi:glycosyltransferase involved in cell wall biosynthesis